MPELPEVEVLARHLRPLLCGKMIRAVDVRRDKVVSPVSPRKLARVLVGARFQDVKRRGKYLLFELRSKPARQTVILLGHLGMTGRMYLTRKNEPLPKHAAVVLDLGGQKFVYDDPRYFGRFTLDLTPLDRLGPEPLNGDFQMAAFAQQLKRSRQPIKIKLLDQSLIAGVGNIYASESLFRAGISPKKAGCKLTRKEIKNLFQAIREILQEAIVCGSTIPLNFSPHKTDGLFYYGSAGGKADFYTEKLRVYDRAGQPCVKCGTSIRRIVQAARSTFFCPQCQKV